jgi:hypothetical protein
MWARLSGVSSLKSPSPAQRASSSGRNSHCCMLRPIASQLPPMPQCYARMLEPSCRATVWSPHAQCALRKHCFATCRRYAAAMPGAESSATSSSARSHVRMHNLGQRLALLMLYSPAMPCAGVCPFSHRGATSSLCPLLAQYR